MDGFRFDLASVMCRDGKGQPLEAPPIVRAIAKDPVLSQVPLPLLTVHGFCTLKTFAAL